MTEAVSPNNELFGLAKLQKLLMAKHSLSLDQLCLHLETCSAEFQQGQQFDDITMLTLKRLL